ncbi:ABC transporter ATP-binding protein [Streptomyces sp. 71268]|uniref:ABC transporter ATP-binding protein n=1 Tax=Streptomyces sp. 71268 TaxID=3002640 RepID=UPI0023F637D1|nr:ABC transporter ATP-binding protein [Streptomyces sp. 71268]WEV25228.1 ABC transporter ATP-binding protein [Streptomyces sp. 71268]
MAATGEATTTEREAPSPEGAREDAGPAKGRSTVRSLLRLWPYVRPIRGRLITAALVAIVASCMSLVIPITLKWIVDGPVADRDPGGAWLGGALLLAIGVAEAVLFGIRRWLVARPLASVEAAMRADLYRHLQRLPVSFHDRWASGQLLSRATTDLQLVRLFLAFPLTFLVVNGATILIGFGILLAQDWHLGLVLMVPAVPMVILCSYFEKRYSLAARRAQDQIGDLTTLVEESVLGIRIVKGFGQHRGQARAFRSLGMRLRETELRKGSLLASLWALIMTLPELALGAALVLGTVQVADGDLSAGTLVAFLSTALALRWPVESIGFLIAVSNDTATATDRYFEVMDAPEAEAAPTGAPSASATASPAPAAATGTESAPAARTGRADAAHDGLRFVDVSFRYPDAPPDSPPLLRGVNLHIRSGETMALVGTTGSGKTTLTALVPRLLEHTEGRITVDGVDITALSRSELRALVAVAFEEPTLFSATAGENVLMGAADAGPRELERALEVAQAGFVHALPKGVDTQVGEQGLSLSGGQRQRLALARAVVGNPRFLILDDPLSALDVHTEALVEAALRQVLAKTTALVVAHRPSTVLLADRVALLSDGRVSAVGTHHELLRTNAEYAALMSGEGSDQP